MQSIADEHIADIKYECGINFLNRHIGLQVTIYFSDNAISSLKVLCLSEKVIAEQCEEGRNHQTNTCEFRVVYFEIT